MEPKEILLELRTKHGLSQEQLAEKVCVTRQAVSRWETGETVPNTETLKLLSKLFDVSINTIQRDITYLARYYPLETAYGRYGGGVYFEQNWQPYRIYMTPLQERALQHAISSAAAEDVVPLQEILQTFARK